MKKAYSPKHLTPDEKKALLKTLADSRNAWRDYFLFDFILNTGLRLSETTRLNIGDVHNGYIAREVLDFISKGNKKRRIPLNKQIRKHIEKYVLRLKKDQELTLASPLFISRVHRRISNRAVQMNLKNWIKASGIDRDYSPHSLRHTVGTEVYKRTNGNIRYTQEFLGHADIRTTQIYTHITDEEMKEVAELLAV